MAKRSKPGRIMRKKKSFKQRTWTKDEIRQLRVLASQKLSAAVIARTSNLGVPLSVAVRWTDDELRRLRKFAAKKHPLPRIAKTLKRIEAAIEKMASNVGISLDMRE